MINNFILDAHIHIDFYDNEFEIIREIIKNNINAIFVTHLPELYMKYEKSINNISNIFLAVGFHPVLVNEYDFNEKLFVESLKKTRFVGEVGLDFTIARSEKSRKKQVLVFNKICRLSNDHILSIHSRNAEKEVLDILIKNKVKKAIFHWYTGSESILESIIEAGYYFSLNPSMLKSSKGKNILKKIPLDKIFIETDGPFVKYKKSIITPNNFENIHNSFEAFYNIDDIKVLIRKNFMEVLE